MHASSSVDPNKYPLSSNVFPNYVHLPLSEQNLLDLPNIISHSTSSPQHLSPLTDRGSSGQNETKDEATIRISTARFLNSATSLNNIPVSVTPTVNIMQTIDNEIITHSLFETTTEEDYNNLVHYISEFIQSPNELINITVHGYISFEKLNCLLGSLGNIVGALTLKETNFSDEEISILLNHCQNLNELNIISNDKIEGVCLNSLFHLTSLQKILIMKCEAFHILPLPNSLENLHTLILFECNALQILTLDNTPANLQDLQIKYCKNIKSLYLNGNFQRLQSFEVCSCKALKILTFPKDLPNLRYLNLWYCKALETLTLPTDLHNLVYFEMSHCDVLEILSLPDDLHNLERLEIILCIAISVLTLPENLQNLKRLKLLGCSALKTFTLPTDLQNLEFFEIAVCKDLHTLTFPQDLQKLRHFEITNCDALPILTLPKNLQILKRLIIILCKTLHTLTFPHELRMLEDLKIRDCESLDLINDSILCQNLLSYYTKITDYSSIENGITLFSSQFGKDHAYTQQLIEHLTIYRT